jgi:hypothetical protein
MSWKDGFYAALLRFLRDEMGHPEAVAVTCFEEDMSLVRCDTCSYTVTTVTISYRTGSSGPEYAADWEGSLVSLITRLSEDGT